MQGLRTHENDSFNRYWGLIQESAAKRGCVFFGFAGEGRDFEQGNMEGEDFSGWLVPNECANDFETAWKGNLFSMFETDYDFVFAEWEKEGDEIIVSFNKYY